MVGALQTDYVLLADSAAARQGVPKTNQEEDGDDTGKQEEEDEEDQTGCKASGGHADDIASVVVQPALHHLATSAVAIGQWQIEGDITGGDHLDDLLCGDVRLGVCLVHLSPAP